jgi:hypothetical protein
VLQQFYGHHYHHSQNGRSGQRISVKARFSAPVQISPGDSLSLLYNGHSVSFSGVKRPERGADYPPPSSAEVKGRIQLYFYPLSGISWPVSGPTFTTTVAATTAFNTWVYYPLLPDLFPHRESRTPKPKAAGYITTMNRMTYLHGYERTFLQSGVSVYFLSQPRKT